jgi:hypothetical protein
MNCKKPGKTGNRFFHPFEPSKNPLALAPCAGYAMGKIFGWHLIPPQLQH